MNKTETFLDYLDPEIADHPVIQGLFTKLKNHEFYAGRNRVTIMLKKHVLKIPRNNDGFADNDWEGSISNSEESYNHPDHEQFPRTRLIYNGGVELLFMEKIDHAYDREVEEYLGLEKGESNWTWSIDGGQVGFTHRGRLVAYDYGMH